MLILNGTDVKRALPMEAAIEAMKEAFAALSDGRAEMPIRAQLSIPPYEAMGLFMPAYVQSEETEGMAVKAVMVYPGNPSLGLPLIHAAVLVMDAKTGRSEALLEGGALTAIRTGAAAGAATDLLARADCHVAAIFGAGVQARTQLEAICTVRPIETAWIYTPDAAEVEAFIDEMAGKNLIPSALHRAENPTQALKDADIICTATTSSTPVFADADLKPGAHINGIGSFTPAMQEIPEETVIRALVVVDSREASMEEAGDLIQPIEAGLITVDHIHAELGQIVLGRQTGRSSSEQITFFKSVGIAVQDVMAAQLALHRARELSLGQPVKW
jgi:alanine dehydrogenase